MKSVALIRKRHPWISEERARDLLAQAGDVLGPFSTDRERLAFVGVQLDFLWGTDNGGKEPRGILG